MKFSIITPSFNQLDWLRLCIASVADQESGIRSQGSGERIEVEHIVQDAGSEGIEQFAREVGAEFYRDGGRVHQPSTINPHSPLSQEEAQLPRQVRSQAEIGNEGNEGQGRYRLSVHTETDAGMYDAINRGLRRAGGEICSYLNCDEQYLPGTLQRVTRAFEEWPDAEVIFGDVIVVGPEGDPLSYRRVVLPDRTQIRRQLNTPTCGTFFSRSVVEKGFLFDPTWKVVGDAAWIEALLKAQIGMKTLSEPLAVFTMTGANLSDHPHAVEELARWRDASQGSKWRRLSSMMIFWMRKMAAGAYRKRKVVYAIRTLSSPLERRQFCGKVGHGWPRAKEE